MLIHLKNIATAEQINAIRSRLSDAEFVDGKLTASGHARKVKQNEQVDAKSKLGSELIAQAKDILTQSPRFLQVSFAQIVRTPLISRYLPGMSYGSHLDKPFMDQNPTIRTDISVTLFLNPPTEYEGGELVIQSDYGEVRFKGGVGDVLLYPSTTYHQVLPVTKGERLVAVTWVQSRVRSAEKRKILYDLLQATGSPEDPFAQTEKGKLLRACLYNLQRMWLE